MKSFTDDDVLKIFMDEVERSSQTEVARKYGIGIQYVCDIVHQRRKISPAMGEKLGFRKTWVSSGGDK